MPTTTVGALPYPADTDAPDVPSDLQALAEALDAYVPVVVYKTATETVTSSTTLQNDDHLDIALQPGTYRVRAVIRAIGASGGDVKIAWAFSGTLTRANRTTMGPQLGTTDATNTAVRMVTAALGTAIGYGTDGSAGSVIEEDLLLTVSVAGTLQMQWAQAGSSGTATELTSECRLYAQRQAIA